MQKLGMRTTKTGIGVFLCTWLGVLLVENVLTSTIACIISMQDTVKDSFEVGWTRIKGTILGGIIGFILVSIAPGYPLVCGLGVILTIYICNLLNLNQGIAIAYITFLSIHLGAIDTTPLEYSFHRVVDTSVGVIIGLTINLLLARPNYFKITVINIEKVHYQITKYMEYKILKNSNNFKLDNLENSFEDLDISHKKLINEIYLKDETHINTLEELVSLYKEIHSHIQSIELLEKDLYLSEENYNYLKSFYKEEDIKYEINDEASPVFNFHFMKIIELQDKINTLNIYSYKAKKCRFKKKG